LALAFGFLLSCSAIFACANPYTASVKLSGQGDTGRPAFPAGFGTLIRFFCFSLPLHTAFILLAGHATVCLWYIGLSPCRGDQK
jgi:hypothetical protein